MGIITIINMEKDKLLKQFIKDLIKMGQPDTIGDRMYYKTNFEIKPKDFLKLVEDNINSNSKNKVVNAVSNLKQAIDCSLDGFFESIGILKKIRRKNLNIEKKLNFIGEIAEFTPRSIVQLNTIRNKLEHQYKMPQIKEINVYYDLVFALVLLIENLCFMPIEINFTDEDSEFNTKYEKTKGNIVFVRNFAPQEKIKLNRRIEISLRDGIDLFIFGIKCHRAVGKLFEQTMTRLEIIKYLNIK